MKNQLTNSTLTDDLEFQLADFNPTGSVEEEWESFKCTVQLTAVQVLGYPTRHQHDWFDENIEEIQVLLDGKHRLHRAYQDDPSSTTKKNAFTSASRAVQSNLRKMQDSWLYSAKADEIQSYVDRNDSRRFYEALNTIYGPRSSGSSPLLNSDGTSLITEKDKI